MKRETGPPVSGVGLVVFFLAIKLKNYFHKRYASGGEIQSQIENEMMNLHAQSAKHAAWWQALKV
jgi:hypothetical protein